MSQIHLIVDDVPTFILRILLDFMHLLLFTGVIIKSTAGFRILDWQGQLLYDAPGWRSRGCMAGLGFSLPVSFHWATIIRPYIISVNYFPSTSLKTHPESTVSPPHSGSDSVWLLQSGLADDTCFCELSAGQPYQQQQNIPFHLDSSQFASSSPPAVAVTGRVVSPRTDAHSSGAQLCLSLPLIAYLW